VTVEIMAMKVLQLGLVLAGAMELTPDNWENQTQGKAVFIKFQATW